MNLNLRNQAEVDMVRGNRCVGCNKTRLSPHQFYEPDPVSRSEGFRVSGIDRPSRFANCRDKTEGHVHRGDVIVDGLRDSDNRDLQIASADLLCNGPCSSECSVSTDSEQDAQIHAFERVDHLPDILRPARRPQNCATFFLNVGNEVGGEFNRFVSVFVRESFIPVWQSEDGANSVMVKQAEHYGSYHVIKAWAQSPTGYDSAFEFRGIKEDLLPGACHFESGRLLTGTEESLNFCKRPMIEDPFVITHELGGRHGRRNPAFAEPLYFEIRSLQFHHEIVPL